jgi:putative membrane protein
LAEPADFDGRVRTVLAHLGAPGAKLLGQGNEGRVYAYRDDRVAKIYMGTSGAVLERLADFQAVLARQGLPFHTPQILEIGWVGGTLFTIERRLPGEKLGHRFAALSQDAQRLALTNYFAAVEAINRVGLANRPFGHVLSSVDGADTITAPTWAGFLEREIERSLERAGADLALDVEMVEDKVRELRRLVLTRPEGVPKRLVHGDYFLGNVLFDRDLQVSAVLDFGAHTLAGDPRMDVAGAIAFLSLDDAIKPWHIAHVEALAEARYGRDIRAVIDLYVLYCSIYFGDTRVSDPSTYRWCVRNLNDASRWQSARG